MTEMNRTHFFVMWLGIIMGGAIFTFLELFEMEEWFTAFYLIMGFIGVMVLLIKDKINLEDGE